ncbi:MAG TPA: hypothetical protein PKY27_10720 [Arachnia sp.]|nr:hypothetical protein [Arachnia sp.]
MTTDVTVTAGAASMPSSITRATRWFSWVESSGTMKGICSRGTAAPGNEAT